MNLSKESAFMGSFWKSICVGDCQTFLGFLRQISVFLESGSLSLYICVNEPHFGKMFICRENKSIIVLKVFSVSCVSLKEIFSRHYLKCILPNYSEWNIRQAWKFSILWVSSKTKFSVPLNARHKEICLSYILSFPSVSL